MQEVLGDICTDRNGVAQLSSIDTATNQRLHSFHRNSFPSEIQTAVRCVAARGRSARVRHWRARVNPRQKGVAGDCDFRNMQIGCLCVCHSQFQNEVIGG